MIYLILLLLLICDWSVQSPIFPTLSTNTAARGFPIPFSTLKTISFKGLPELPILNETIGQTRSLYCYEQLVAVLDIKEGKTLIHCELIEVYEPIEAEEVLKNLSTSLKPHRISFNDMLKIMEKCDQLDENLARTISFFHKNVESLNENSPLLAGIIPGTKWCGTGDIAKNYHDLGSRTRVDRCCRAHDLCPVKIRAYRSRYNLMNNSFFSKSHCNCDKIFYDCLKSINHVSARVIGNIYFNIAQPQCIEDISSSSEKNLKKLVSIKTRF